MIKQMKNTHICNCKHKHISVNLKNNNTTYS